MIDEDLDIQAHSVFAKEAAACGNTTDVLSQASKGSKAGGVKTYL